MGTQKEILHLIPSHASQDGDGVKIQRVAGPMLNQWMDPYLMLDELRSDDAADYIGGFPPHPHRGFETITYMIDGKMRHRDHMGNEGLIVSGGVQWMTAGKGVIHSEMPEQEEGLLHGFQLWLNLPAAEKMKPSAYRDIQSEEIPELSNQDGAVLRVIAGTLDVEDQSATGPIADLTTEPVILDLLLPKSSEISLELPEDHTTLVYVFDGDFEQVPHRQMGVFGVGESLSLSSIEGGRALILAGTALKEPVVQHGPFVMNSVEEIHQAITDYQSGTLAG